MAGRFDLSNAQFIPGWLWKLWVPTEANKRGHETWDWFPETWDDDDDDDDGDGDGDGDGDAADDDDADGDGDGDDDDGDGDCDGDDCCYSCGFVSCWFFHCYCNCYWHCHSQFIVLCMFTYIYI